MTGCFQGLRRVVLDRGGPGRRADRLARERPLTPLWLTMNGHVTGTEPRGIYVALRVRASGVSAVVDEPHSLVIGSCGSALELVVTCCFGSRQFSSLHAICGAHVPGTRPVAHIRAIGGAARDLCPWPAPRPGSSL